jgi:hypothetical protein
MGEIINMPIISNLVGMLDGGTGAFPRKEGWIQVLAWIAHE